MNKKPARRAGNPRQVNVAFFGTWAVVEPRGPGYLHVSFAEGRGDNSAEFSFRRRAGPKRETGDDPTSTSSKEQRKKSIPSFRRTAPCCVHPAVSSADPTLLATRRCQGQPQAAAGCDTHPRTRSRDLTVGKRYSSLHFLAGARILPAAAAGRREREEKRVAKRKTRVFAQDCVA
ncbi:hypothetical protein BKA80DRAFT_24187 [Phyllosticta citrichinensis]